MFSGCCNPRPPPPLIYELERFQFPTFSRRICNEGGGEERSGGAAGRGGGGLLREKNGNMTQFHKKLARLLLTRKKWAVLGGAKKTVCIADVVIWFFSSYPWLGRPKGEI